MKIISLVHGPRRLDQFRKPEMEISIKRVLSILHHLKKLSSLKIRNPKHLKRVFLPCRLCAEYIHVFCLFLVLGRCGVSDPSGLGSGTSLSSLFFHPTVQLTLHS